MKLIIYALLLVGTLGFGQNSSIPFATGSPVAAHITGVTYNNYSNPGAGNTYYYWLATTYPVGSSISPIPLIVDNINVADPSVAHTVTISLNPVYGASSYSVLRSTTSAMPTIPCTCLVGTTTAGATSIVDNGAALAAFAPTIAPPTRGSIRLNNQIYPIPTFESEVDGRVTPFTTSVASYGAIGDGIADDTTAIQRAHNLMCAMGGGKLVYPRGTYLVSPVAGASKGTFQICSNLQVSIESGAVVKVKPNAGNYYALYTTATGATTANNLSFVGPGTIDQNVANNTTSTISVASGATTAQYAIYVPGGTNLEFRWLKILASGINTIVCGTPSSNVTLAHNTITFQKRAGNAAFDNSAFYIYGPNMHVIANTLSSTLADSAAGGIEVHGASGEITGNNTNFYSAAMNIVDSNNMAVTGNSANNTGYGIVLYSTTTSSNIAITGNSIFINNVDRASTTSSGITTIFTNGVTGNYSNLTITGNTILGQPEVADRSVVSGSNVGIGLNCHGSITTAVISDNTLVSLPIRGVIVGQLDLTSTYSNITITNNTVVDAGTTLNASNHNSAASFALQGNLTDVTMWDNIARFTSNPLTGLNAYWTFATGGFTFTRTYVYNNQISAVNGTPGTVYDAQTILSPPYTVSSLEILGGWCNGTITSNATVNLLGVIGHPAAGACTSTSAAVSGVPLRAGTIKNLRVRALAVSGTVGSGVVTVQKNNVSQTMTCTLSTVATCSDLTHTFSIVDGDTVSIRVQSTAASGDTLGTIFASVQLQ